MGIQQSCTSFTRLPGVGASMFAVAQALLGLLSFPCYARNTHRAQASVGILLPRRKWDFWSPSMNAFLVKPSTCEKKQIYFKMPKKDQ